jgi:hypothetical protein
VVARHGQVGRDKGEAKGYAMWGTHNQCFVTFFAVEGTEVFIIVPVHTKGDKTSLSLSRHITFYEIHRM